MVVHGPRDPAAREVRLLHLRGWEGHGGGAPHAGRQVLDVRPGRRRCNGARTSGRVTVMVPCWRVGGSKSNWGSDLGGYRGPSLLSVMQGARFGSFLRHVPASRRIGDFAHAAARVVNAVFKRTYTTAPAWGRSAAKDLHQCPYQWICQGRECGMPRHRSTAVGPGVEVSGQ